MKEYIYRLLGRFRSVVLPAVTLLAVVATGCAKDELPANDPHRNFDALWRILDERYCFFAYKEVDWDAVYRKYKPQVTDTMSQYALFDLMSRMLAELKDGHTNLVSSFNTARYWDWYEAHPRNFDNDIHRAYLGKDRRIAGGIQYRTMAGGRVGYMYYGSFSSGFGESTLDHILTYFKACQGMIIDVRENGGGSLTYSDRLAARFLESSIVAGYIVHKTGTGHNDFSEPYPIELKPTKGVRWQRPVIVLTNRHSYSATNDFVNKMKQLPNVTIMGDRTGGGSGLPFNSELPNGWRVRFSASPLLDAARQHTEQGIDPDVWVSLLPDDVERGRDTLIEAAIARLTDTTAHKSAATHDRDITFNP